MVHKINPPPQSTRLMSPSLSPPPILPLLSDDASCDASPDTRDPASGRQLSIAESVGVQGDGEEESYAVGSVHALKTTPSIRGDPDGQPGEGGGVFLAGPSPDVDSLLRAESDVPPIYPSSVTAPPSTPLVTNGNSRPAITPATIQSALEALAQIAASRDAPNCSTPHEDVGMGLFCPEAIASALSAWIANQGGSIGGTPLVSPPPSTPLEVSGGLERVQAGGGGSISASDLMAALMALIQPPEGADDSSGGNSLSCSAPHSTPQEGLPLGEWLRLGIHPEEVLQALTALTAHRSGDETGDESVSLAPITEEGCGDAMGSDSGEGTRECPGTGTVALGDR